MLKQNVSKFMRKKIFYRFWRKLYEVSLYGMNMGPASGYPHYSGEEWIINFVKNCIKHPLPIVFDVGANRGDYAAAILESFGCENIRLHCFEPSKTAFGLLNVELSACQNVKLYNFGFGDKPETVNLYSCSEAAGSASIVNTHGPHMDNNNIVEAIELSTLDEFCNANNIQKIDFMKIDVEGYELKILCGGSKLINAASVDFIQFEFGYPGIESRVFFKDIFSYLAGNYRVYRSLIDGLIEIEQYDYKDELYTIQNFLAISKKICVDTAQDQ
jgi:FkbM family methyltransferase